MLMTIPFNASGKIDTSLNDSLLELNEIGGGTVYYLGIFSVYDAKFYAKDDADKASILEGRSSKCLVIEYNRSISAEDIVKGANIVLSRQHGGEVLEQQKQFIEAIHQSYTDVSEGDSYALCYDANSSVTRLFFNGSAVAEVESKDFANLYFGIWLGGEKPISESLRKKLLQPLAGR